MEFFLSVIGMVLIVEGLPYFAFPDRMKTMMRKIQELPGGSLRIFGLVLMGSGLMLIYLGRR